MIREDPVNADLLFLGTEMGLWSSIDGGATVGAFSGNVPRVSVRDLAIHPREHDLIDRHPRPWHLHPRRPDAAAGADRRGARVEVALLPSRPR